MKKAMNDFWIAFLDKLFHTHHFKSVATLTEYKHFLDDGSSGKCPYLGCTKFFKMFYCTKCGKELKIQIDENND